MQLARPEVSAATASVVDRATAKDLAQRYPDAASMVADLEEALAIEASRSGQATGEVTTVLRTLPGTHAPAAAVAHAPPRALDRLARAARGARRAGVDPRRRTAPTAASRRTSLARPGLTAVPLAQTAAHDYNPFGTGPENREDDQNAVDGDPNTSWSTEHYYDGTLKKAGGTGVGLYVDAAPASPASRSKSRRPPPASPRRSTSPTRSTCRCPTATRPRSPRAAGTVRSGKTPTSATAPTSSSPSAGRATATTSSGSPRCRPAWSSRRSPNSPCSLSPPST